MRTLRENIEFINQLNEAQGNLTFRCFFGGRIKYRSSSRSANAEWMEESIEDLIGQPTVSDPEGYTGWNPAEDYWGDDDLENTACVHPIGPNAGVGFVTNDREDVKKVAKWVAKNSNGTTYYWIKITGPFDPAAVVIQAENIPSIVRELAGSIDEARQDFADFVFKDEALRGDLTDDIQRGLMELDEELPSGARFVTRRHDPAEYADHVLLSGRNYDPAGVMARLNATIKECAAVNIQRKLKALYQAIPKLYPAADPSTDPFILVNPFKDVASQYRTLKSKLSKGAAKPEPQVGTNTGMDGAAELSETIRRMRELAGIRKK
jgi:hypothetical protein